MAEIEAPAAPSSHAAPTTESAPSSPANGTEAVSIPKDPKAYAEWRQTGKLPGDPKDKPSKEDPAPSKSSADEESGKGAPASEAGHKGQVRTNAETRKEELNREIRELLSKRDQLRKEVDTGKPPEPAGKTDVKAEPSPAPAQPESKRPVKPKQDDFDNWEQYDAAKDKYDEDLADWKAAQRIEEYEQKQRQEAQTREMQNRLNEAKERYGAEAEPKIVETAKTVFNDQEVPPAIKTALGRSEVLVDALYVMGSDRAELDQFLDLAKKDPLEALRKWFTVEALVKEELATSGKTAPARGADGKFLPEKATEKPARQRPPAPPTELNGSGSPPGDIRISAAEKGDFRSFKQDADRRDIARLRGQ